MRRLPPAIAPGRSVPGVGIARPGRAVGGTRQSGSGPAALAWRPAGPARPRLVRPAAGPGRPPREPAGRLPARPGRPPAAAQARTRAGPLKNIPVGISFREPAEPLSNGLGRLVIAAFPQGKLGQPQPSPVLEVRRAKPKRQIGMLPGGRKVAPPSEQRAPHLVQIEGAPAVTSEQFPGKSLARCPATGVQETEGKIAGDVAARRT